MAAPTLADLAKLFLRLGFTAFGGPAAHIAMKHREVVENKGWITEQHFLDLVGATNLIPGPNSTEMAIHIGREKAGWKGLVVAGACFILPAVTITGIIAWLYRAYGYLPDVQRFIYGVEPAIIAVILAAVYPLARRSVTSVWLLLIGLATLVLALFGFSEIFLMFGAGIAGLLIDTARRGNPSSKQMVLVALPAQLATYAADIGNWKLFLIFLKIGSVLYGSGYVLFAFLDAELVQPDIITRAQLIDAIAVGQFTPGPVFSSVTFIGYQIGGIQGAVISTVGIFLPAFLFVALLNPLVKKMRSSEHFKAFLDAVNVASVAIIASVCYTMAVHSIVDWRTVTIAMASLVLSFGFRHINSAWIVIASALAGYLLSLV
ncbi:MAG TPA: chromate efflux transporter [Chryseosolibacter sp.]|nr:chromate efflux transporter [Chryseosolibacter sp.]